MSSLRSAIRRAGRPVARMVRRWGGGADPGPGGPAARLDQLVPQGATEPPPEPEPGLAVAHHIHLDYPLRSLPRYGHGRPPHPQLTTIIERGRDRYRRLLESFLAHRDCFLRIPASDAPDARDPHWVTDWFPGLDAIALHCLLAENNPERYLEVGSGMSTRIARRAIRDHGLRTRILSVDPCPRVEIDAICDEVVRAPFEDVDVGIVDQLGDGDILFVDGSHRCFMNSDVTAVFLDFIPRLRPGVLVHIHDIFLPRDYPPGWVDRFYSEQYLLAVALLAEGPHLEIVLPNAFVAFDDELRRILEPIWQEPHMAGVNADGGSFWIRRSGAG
jgi:hypothetical protein